SNYPLNLLRHQPVIDVESSGTECTVRTLTGDLLCVKDLHRKTTDDIGASGSETENCSSEDEDEEDLVDNCWDDETDDQVSL
ncbi:unnamed protein product, partial [Didymodactylos carnosus]